MKSSVRSKILGGSEKKGRNHEGKKLGLLPLDSASSKQPDDSGQALDLTPNRRGSSNRNDFGGQPVARNRLASSNQRTIDYQRPLSLRLPKLIGTTSLATDDLRTSTKNNLSLVEH